MTTTHSITEKRDSKGIFFTCTRCGKESGASTKGQADNFMGVCQSAEAILETPEQARYHEVKQAAKAEAPQCPESHSPPDRIPRGSDRKEPADRQ